jgi:hypothetical protein
MTVNPYSDFQENWFAFLRRYTIIMNRNLPYALTPTGANPLLSYALMSLLTVNLVSILYEGLDVYIKANNISVKNDKLFYKIEALKLNNHLNDVTGLHILREARNTVAHTNEMLVDGDKLAEYISLVDETFQQLNLTSTRPDYQASFYQDPVEPLTNDIVESVIQRFCLTLNGVEILVFRSRVDFFPNGGWVLTSIHN